MEGLAFDILVVLDGCAVDASVYQLYDVVTKQDIVGRLHDHFAENYWGKK